MEDAAAKPADAVNELVFADGEGGDVIAKEMLGLELGKQTGSDEVGDNLGSIGTEPRGAAAGGNELPERLGLDELVSGEKVEEGVGVDGGRMHA